jgi:hypothetical protein
MSESTAGGEWLTVAQAANRLGVSPRAVQKRCANGTLAARRVSTPAGDRWEVEAANLDASRTRAGEPIGREPREPDASLDGVSRLEPCAPVANLDANPRAIGREPDANEPTREAELREEVKFLRSLLEARDRDAAELRAALREALRLAPKQLPTGASDGAQDVPTAQDTVTTQEGSTGAQKATETANPRREAQAALTTNASQSSAAAKQNAQRQKMKPWQRAIMRVIGAR